MAPSFLRGMTCKCVRSKQEKYMHNILFNFPNNCGKYDLVTSIGSSVETLLLPYIDEAKLRNGTCLLGTISPLSFYPESYIFDGDVLGMLVGIFRKVLN